MVSALANGLTSYGSNIHDHQHAKSQAPAGRSTRAHTPHLPGRRGAIFCRDDHCRNRGVYARSVFLANLTTIEGTMIMSDQGFQTVDGCARIADSIKAHIDMKMTDVMNAVKQIDGWLHVDNGSPCIQSRLRDAETAIKAATKAAALAAEKAAQAAAKYASDSVPIPKTWSEAARVALTKHPGVMVASIVGGIVLLHQNGLLPQVFKLIEEMK